MSGEIIVTLCGNVVKDPDLRVTASGVSVVSFTVASTPRTYKDGEWKDGEPTFVRCQAWRTMADNVTESLSKGSRVVVTGKFFQRSYEKDGEKRTTYELLVDDVGPSLKFHAAKIVKAKRDTGGSQNEDPWASATPVGASTGGSGNGGYNDDPPF